MIVRTYGRRSRCSSSRSYSDSDFNGDGEDTTTTFRDSLSQEIYNNNNNVGFSSQDSSSSPWAFDSAAAAAEIYNNSNSSQGSLLSQGGDGGVRKSKKTSSSSSRRTLINRELKESSNNVKKKSSISRGVPSTTTSTLMEAQEFGEMMEHVDEVNFALDGLRKGQPSRIRRASLLSLLSICSTATQRRLLRTHGMAKTIIDAILALSFDDSPSTLAAAALFYILSSDGQDEHLLDSPICVRFLLRLLSPSMPVSADDKVPTIGCKLLALRRDPGILRDQTNRLDASSTAIISKVQDILLSSKEIEASSRDDDGVGRPELNSKWIALLTMEKACLSTVSLEDTSDMVRRVGGNFKEKLRELGGLDAVFDVARDCHSVMERWSEKSLSSLRELKDDVVLQTIILLLKCLKIMENATFLSKDNQNHLLGMTGKSGCKDSSLSFTNLMISVIKILSGLSLVRGSSTSRDDRSHFVSNGKSHTSKISLKEYDRVDRNGDLSSSSSGRCDSMETVSDINNLKTSKKRPRLSTSQSVYSVSSSETTSASTANVFSVKSFKSSTSGSCNGISRSSSVGVAININNLKMNAGLSKRPSVTENIEDISLDDSQDPFAFDADEFAPSKWDMLARKKEVPRTKKNRVMFRDFDGGCEPPKITSHLESIKEEACRVIEITDSDSPPVEEENPKLLSDCLLTAVKVLMNLTNDNPVGCQQIAAGGGLETLSNLIVGHFPSFSSCISSCSQTSDATLTPRCSPELVHQTDRHLTDQELDFLVAILGLLVNLVEKDSRNRSRLAAASVSLPISGGETRSRRDVISLLCSIFLANQGAGEAAEDGRLLPWNDEAAVLQGEREAEKMIIEAYAALLLAFLSTESKIVREAIACCLPDHNLEVLVPVLERFVAFHLTLNMISPETHSAVSEVIESCRGR